MIQDALNEISLQARNNALCVFREQDARMLPLLEDNCPDSIELWKNALDAVLEQVTPTQFELGKFNSVTRAIELALGPAYKTVAKGMSVVLLFRNGEHWLNINFPDLARFDRRNRG